MINSQAKTTNILYILYEEKKYRDIRKRSPHKRLRLVTKDSRQPSLLDSKKKKPKEKEKEKKILPQPSLKTGTI